MEKMNTTAYEKALTTNDLRRIFGVSAMTILSWRRQKKLPTIVIKGDRRNTIRFRPDEIQQWAEENGKKIVVPIKEAINLRSAK
ncbi:hypothetical protein LCGC14_2851410 [marine sediment metagenome]|uniref:Helix-turn-helix domain-containing protein n=1 Tax=marine sediment metagenome TaxID=412755 RepID=A0A0F8Y899_9ZZZZ